MNFHSYHNKLNALLTEENSEWKDTPFMHYLRGVRLLEVDNNPNAAMNEFSKLPKKMNDRQVMEARCLMHKDFKKRDGKKAVKMLQKIEKDMPQAAFELAMLQMNGEFIDKDSTKAIKTLTALAKEDYAPAIDFLADCYYLGHGVKKDKTKAYLLYFQAEKIQRLTETGARRLLDALKNGENMKSDPERIKEIEKYRAYETRTLLMKVTVK
jgi:TPR repeat protein